jgi:lysozyme family protein
MTDDRFERCLLLILREEGGNDDDPQDHGGRTSRGITQREYDKWRAAHNQPKQDVWAASTQEIHDIYYEGYWFPRCPKLHPGVDLSYFNICVNAGPGRAYAILRKSVGGTDAQTVERFNDNVVAFYRNLKQFSLYGKGWLGRSARIYAAAKKMVDPNFKPVEAPVTTTPVAAPAANPIAALASLNLAQIETFIEAGDKVLPVLALVFPPAKVMHEKGIPILEGLIKIGMKLQAGGADPSQLMADVAAEIHLIGELIHPGSTQKASTVAPAAAAQIAAA